MKQSKKASKIVIYIVLSLGAIVMIVPFLWMFLTAFKSTTEATQIDPFVILPSTWRLESIKSAFTKLNLGRIYWNTILMIAERFSAKRSMTPNYLGPFSVGMGFTKRN